MESGKSSPVNGSKRVAKAKSMLEEISKHSPSSMEKRERSVFFAKVFLSFGIFFVYSRIKRSYIKLKFEKEFEKELNIEGLGPYKTSKKIDNLYKNMLEKGSSSSSLFIQFQNEVKTPLREPEKTLSKGSSPKISQSAVRFNDQLSDEKIREYIQEMNQSTEVTLPGKKSPLKKMGIKNSQGFELFIKKFGKEITRLELDSFVSNKDLSLLSKHCPCLKEIVVKGGNVSNKGLSRLADLPLTKMTLVGLELIDNKCFKSFSQEKRIATTLKNLEISGCSISGDCFSSISFLDLENIRFLSNSAPRDETVKGFKEYYIKNEKIVKKEGLKTLDFSGSSIDHYLLDHILRNSPSLERLTLRHCQRIDFDALSEIYFPPNLKLLDLSSNNLTEENIKSIFSKSNLRSANWVFSDGKIEIKPVNSGAQSVQSPDEFLKKTDAVTPAKKDGFSSRLPEKDTKLDKFTELKKLISRNYPSFKFIYSDIESFQKDGHPLHFAVHEKDLDLLKAIVEAGADLTQKDVQGNTVFDLLPDVLKNSKGCEGPAIINYLKKVIIEKVKKGEIVNSFISDPPLHFAVKMKDLDLLKALVEAGADLTQKNQNGETVLDDFMDRYGSAREWFNDPTIVSMFKYLNILIKDNKGFNFDLSKKGTEDFIVRLILSQKANLTTAKELIEFFTKKTKHLDPYQYLAHAILDKANSLDQDTRSLKGLIEHLIEKGLSVDATDDIGRSLLYKAVSRRDKDLVEFLLKKKANPDLGTNDLKELILKRIEMSKNFKKTGLGSVDDNFNKKEQLDKEIAALFENL